MFPHLLAGGLGSSVILELLRYQVQLGLPSSHPLLFPLFQLLPLLLQPFPPLPPTVSPGSIFGAQPLPQVTQHRVPSGLPQAGLLPLIPVFVLKQLVELVSPVANTADVEGEVGTNLGGRTDREGMPLTAGNTETDN